MKTIEAKLVKVYNGGDTFIVHGFNGYYILCRSGYEFRLCSLNDGNLLAKPITTADNFDVSEAEITQLTAGHSWRHIQVNFSVD